MVAFERGEGFMSSLAAFCHDNWVRQGYIPMFLAGFAQADIVRTSDQDHRQGPSVLAGQPVTIKTTRLTYAKTTLTVIFHRFD